MNVIRTRFAGVLLFNAAPERDERGYFARLFDRAMLEAAGCSAEFPQWSVAFNERAGTLRGLHWSAAPNEETKLVRVVAGAIHDVLVDLRPKSATFGESMGFELREGDGSALYVPAGIAHGYQALADRTFVTYAISCPYVAGAARGINALDPTLRIDWPLPPVALSPRDRGLPTLAAYLRLEGHPAWSR